MTHSSIKKEKHRWSGGQDRLVKRYNNFVVIPPFEVNADPCILLANDDAPYLRRDHNQGTFVKRKSVTANLSCT